MKGKINIFEYAITIFMSISASFTGIGIFNLLKISKLDSIISLVISYLMTLLIMFVFLYINDYKKDLNIIDKIKILFNHKLSKILISLLSLCFFILLCINYYDISSFIISQFLSETPLIIIVILIGILVIYINSKGVKTIFRVSNLLLYIIIFLFMFYFLGKYEKFDLLNLNPFFKNGLFIPYKGGLIITLMNSIHLFLFLIIPKENIKTKNICIPLIITISFVFLVFILTTIYIISVLGIDLALQYNYPSYIIMKEITIFSFIDKIENFIIIFWVFEIFILLSFITNFIHQSLNISYTIVTFVAILTTIFTFKNNILYSKIVSIIIPIISIIIITIMLIISIKITIKKLTKS